MDKSDDSRGSFTMLHRVYDDTDHTVVVSVVGTFPQTFDFHFPHFQEIAAALRSKSLRN